MILGSKTLIRDMNSKLVLETIINNDPISRAAISKKLGLTKATISAIVSDLINKHLVIEIGSDDTQLGRKPILLRFNQKAGFSICIDVGVLISSCMVADLRGENQCIKQIKTPPNSTIISDFIELIQSMEKHFQDSPYGLIGITLGIHGITNKDEILFTPYNDLKEVPFKKEFSEHFGIPVVLENEANLSALGEYAFLSDQYQNLANISIHSGVGMGVILNGSLFKGNMGHAGELGHTIVELNGRPCPCGNNGCLEQYTSERALLFDYSMKINKNNIVWNDFIQAYSVGDQAACEIVDQFIRYMSQCINNLTNTLSPEIIIINSSLVDHFPQLINRLNKKLTSKILSNFVLIPSKRKDSSILLGGIYVAICNFLDIETILFHEQCE